MPPQEHNNQLSLSNPCARTPTYHQQEKMARCVAATAAAGCFAAAAGYIAAAGCIAAAGRAAAAAGCIAAAASCSEAAGNDHRTNPR